MANHSKATPPSFRYPSSSTPGIPNRNQDAAVSEDPPQAAQQIPVMALRATGSKGSRKHTERSHPKEMAGRIRRYEGGVGMTNRNRPLLSCLLSQIKYEESPPATIEGRTEMAWNTLNSIDVVSLNRQNTKTFAVP